MSRCSCQSDKWLYDILVALVLLFMHDRPLIFLRQK